MTRQGITTVARQEFRLRIRAGRWRWLLAAWFVVLLAFTALLRGALSGGLTDETIEFKGTIVYGGLMLFVLGLAQLVVPALAAQSVNGDRERGTLATLQVTRLTAGDIALGKFVAAWGTSLVFLALTLPLVGFAMTQGGVPPSRVVVVTAVLATLLGTVCAVSLALSALLSRTTTSGVLAYLSVFALSIGTAVTFGLVTAATAESYTEVYETSCLTPGDAQGLSEDELELLRQQCKQEPESYETSRLRPDRTWWLLAANPFVILADAAPQLPPETAAERSRRELSGRGNDARSVDPLGQLGSAVRDIRRAPAPLGDEGVLVAEPDEPGAQDRGPAVWPTGLALNVALASSALWLTTRRLRTPSRVLPQGQRVA